MKKIIVFVTGALLAGSALAARDKISTQVAHRRSFGPVNPAARTEGALQRGVRMGNPAQMFNPAAPSEYGEGREFVTARDHEAGLQPRDRSREFPVALRLFSIPFNRGEVGGLQG